MFDTLQSIIMLLLGSSGAVGVIGMFQYRRATKRAKEAEAKMAESNADLKQWERYEKQIDHSHHTIEILQKQIEDDAKTIADKTTYIRQIVESNLVAQQELNEVNAKLLKVTEERDSERLMKEKYKAWHCKSSICREGHPDPKGRRPPNPKILGKKFSEDSETID